MKTHNRKKNKKRTKSFWWLDCLMINSTAAAKRLAARYPRGRNWWRQHQRKPKQRESILQRPRHIVMLIY